MSSQISLEQGSQRAARRRPVFEDGDISGTGGRRHRARGAVVHGGININPAIGPVQPPPRRFLSFKSREVCNIAIILLLMLISVISMPQPKAPPPIHDDRLFSCYVCIGLLLAFYFYKLQRDYKFDSAFLFWHKNTGFFYEKSISHVIGLIFILLSISNAYASLNSRNKQVIFDYSVSTTVFSFLYAASQSIHSDKDHATVSTANVDGEMTEVYRMQRRVTAHPSRGHLLLLEDDPNHPSYFL